MPSPPWPRCPRCHRPQGSGRAPAADCLECRRWPDALSASRFAFLLREPASSLVHGLKYEGWRGLERFMGDAIAGALAADAAPDAVVVPVPTTPQRERLRGYNQAALLADRVAACRGAARVDALQRPVARASQTDLAPEARWENVRAAFVPSREVMREIDGRHVLLIDDVLTTGATACAAAVVLSRAGARSVTLGAFARSLPRVDADEAHPRAA
jgi:ComF family protein